MTKKAKKILFGTLGGTVSLGAVAGIVAAVSIACTEDGGHLIVGGQPGGNNRGKAIPRTTPASQQVFQDGEQLLVGGLQKLSNDLNTAVADLVLYRQDYPSGTTEPDVQNDYNTIINNVGTEISNVQIIYENNYSSANDGFGAMVQQYGKWYQDNIVSATFITPSGFNTKEQSVGNMWVTIQKETTTKDYQSTKSYPYTGNILKTIAADMKQLAVNYQIVHNPNYNGVNDGNTPANPGSGGTKADAVVVHTFDVDSLTGFDLPTLGKSA